MTFFDLFRAATRVGAASTFMVATTFCRADPSFNASELDALFAGKKWSELGAALSQPERDEKKTLGWMKTKVVSTGAYPIALLYAHDLWLVGLAIPSSDPDKDLRVSSGVVTLFAYASIAIDGQKCADRSAPARRLDQLYRAQRETLSYVQALPPDLKGKVINLAVSLEKKTAAARKDEDVICRDATAAKQDAPTLLPEQDYLTKQQSARANLKSTLEKFMQ